MTIGRGDIALPVEDDAGKAFMKLSGLRELKWDDNFARSVNESNLPGACSPLLAHKSQAFGEPAGVTDRWWELDCFDAVPVDVGYQIAYLFKTPSGSQPF